MHSAVQRALEFAVPLLLAYVFFGAPLPSFIRSTGTAQDARLSYGKITKENVDWAVETLALPGEKQDLRCSNHSYGAHIFSRDPLVIYMENFLSAAEVAELLKQSEPYFKTSTIWAGITESSDQTIRKSEKAPLDRSSSTTLCIEERALSLQGWRSDVFIEKLWAQRYRTGDHYKHHYDWGASGKSGGRVSSFMVWLDDKCEGGGTNFPHLQRHADDKWCRFHDCSQEVTAEHPGTTWNPAAGNAVYWENFRSDGSGYEESWHAGLPVTSGTKVGLNIWSWWQPGLLDAVKNRSSEMQS